MTLKISERQSSISGWVDLSKTEMSSFLIGLVSEHGLTDMLRATAYDSLDKMFLFLGAFTDVLCGNGNELEIKKFFTKYDEPSLCLQGDNKELE